MSVLRCGTGPPIRAFAWSTFNPARYRRTPPQHADIERFNRTVRDDWLAQTLFESITEVQDTATRWLWTYNHERPNMTLGGTTPAQR